MFVAEVDDKLRNVKLSVDELNILIDSLEDLPYRVSNYYGDLFTDLHSKLKDALENKEVKNE